LSLDVFYHLSPITPRPFIDHAIAILLLRCSHYAHFPLAVDSGYSDIFGSLHVDPPPILPFSYLDILVSS
jgi:hypothetical protein